MRSFARATVWALGGLIVLLALWLGANRLLDEPLGTEAASLLRSAETSIPDAQNVAVGILGLTAPENSDFIAYGAQIKSLYLSNAPRAQIREMQSGPKSLRPTVSGGQIDCWLDPDWQPIKGCLPFEKATAILDENKELLARYKALYRLEQYDATDGHYSEAYFLLARLAVAEMQVDLRQGRHEDAYRKWRDNLRFVRRNLRAQDTWVGKAIGLVAMGFPVPFLESLLIAAPDMAKRHRAELRELLRSEGIAAFGSEGIVRAEFTLFAKALEQAPPYDPAYGFERTLLLAYYLGQKNRLLNRYAVFASEYEAMLRLPWHKMGQESARLLEKHALPGVRDAVLDPFGSLLFAQYIDGQLRARELTKQMHIKDGRIRLGSLLVELTARGLTDAEIPAFLAGANADLLDPFTGTPARWDPKDRKIYFLDPDDRCIVGTWFRVPGPGRKSESSVVNTNAC